MVFFGESSLRRVLRDYLEHYHDERNHQGIGNELIQRRILPKTGDITSCDRLGGLLRYYYQA